MPERFSGRLWHALKRYLGPEVVTLIAQALAGQGIRLHWDFLTETPLHSVLPELAARGIPENEWPDDSNDNGSAFYPGYFRDRYGYCRDGCDTSSESDGETFYLEQCVEAWVWKRGILFTDYGRELVKELVEIVTFEDDL